MSGAAGSGHEVVRQLSDALVAAGFVASPVVFDSRLVPDTVKDHSFRIVPGEISPEPGGAAVTVEVGFEVYIAYAHRRDAQERLVSEVIMPDLDALILRLIDLPAWSPTILARIEPDTESGRYLVMVLGVRMAYCLARAT